METKSNSLVGVPATPGIIIGRAVVLDKDPVDIKPISINDSLVKKEIRDFQKAISRVRKDLLNLSIAVGKRLGKEYALIFEAQAMIADDQVINNKVIELIGELKQQAAFLYYQEINVVIEQLSQSDNPYLKERILDIKSVCTRLLSVLQGVKKTVVGNIEGPTIVIAKYLAPSDLLGFSVRKKIGFALELGGVTSHTSLLAKSLNLPAIVGVRDILEKVCTGDKVIMDGYSGKLIIRPGLKVTRQFRRRINFLKEFNLNVGRIKNKQAITRDGCHVKVLNNIELPSESLRVAKSGAEGIGLFRTEYLFITEDSFPGFDEQYKAYKSILTRMGSKPSFIRTFDLGGDKFVVDKLQAVDPNPFLGWRAIRYCLDRPDVFKTQLKALLKSSKYGNLQIMLPMISNLDELRETKKLIEESKQELISEKVKLKKNIPLGIMIEVPSAAIMAEHLAQEVDFFSIGTNDLIQYTLAVDRTNEKIARLYQSFNPAVFRMIKQTIDAGHKHNIKVGICGELASDPLAVIVLTGMGIDSLSTSYLSTGMIKYIIGNIDLERAKMMAGDIVEMKTESQVTEYLRHKTYAYFPELIPLIEFIQGASHD